MDRATALRQAQALLRQGQTDAAIAAYVLVVEAQPSDWNTANLLGDLYLGAGEPERAIEQFVRVADGLAREGFLSKAAALYRKALRVRPDNEPVLLKAAGIAAGQGLIASARAHLAAVVSSRLERRDHAGAREVSARLAALEVGELRPPVPAIPSAAGQDRVAEMPASEFRIVAPAPNAAVETTDPGEADEIDLTLLLEQPPSPASEPELQGDDLDSVFEELRSATRSSGSESPDETYTKGLASYAAGAIDECLPALRTAARAPHLRFAAASLLGRIWRSRGELVEAVEWLERAAEAPAPSLDESRRLLYDLADALEQAGEHARALAVLLELQADAAGYRDVGARIDRLLM